MKKLLASLVLFTLITFGSSQALAQSGGELHFCLRSEPKTFNPLLAADDSSETIRYLTGGVLARVNRLTQDLEPELATAWKVTNGGKTITSNCAMGCASRMELHFPRMTSLIPCNSLWIPPCTRRPEMRFVRQKAKWQQKFCRRIVSASPSRHPSLVSTDFSTRWRLCPPSLRKKRWQCWGLTTSGKTKLDRT